MPDGRCVQFDLKNDEFTENDFNQPEFKRGLDLLASALPVAPKYKDSGSSCLYQH